MVVRRLVLVLLTATGLTPEPKEDEGCLTLPAGSMKEGSLSTAAGSTEEVARQHSRCECATRSSIESSTPGATLLTMVSW